jgi:DnaJ-class molecular chaperone
MSVKTYGPHIKSEQIIICSRCGGSGEKLCSKLIDYHKNKSEYWHEKCQYCDGMGRLKEKVESVFTTLPIHEVTKTQNVDVKKLASKFWMHMYRTNYHNFASRRKHDIEDAFRFALTEVGVDHE